MAGEKAKNQGNVWTPTWGEPDCLEAAGASDCWAVARESPIPADVRFTGSSASEVTFSLVRLIRTSAVPVEWWLQSILDVVSSS